MNGAPSRTGVWNRHALNVLWLHLVAQHLQDTFWWLFISFPRVCVFYLTVPRLQRAEFSWQWTTLSNSPSVFSLLLSLSDSFPIGIMKKMSWLKLSLTGKVWKFTIEQLGKVWSWVKNLFTWLQSVLCMCVCVFPQFTEVRFYGCGSLDDPHVSV